MLRPDPPAGASCVNGLWRLQASGRLQRPATRAATTTAATPITAVRAKTPPKDAAVVGNAAKTMPVVARDSAPPSESEMDIAELLKPSFSLLDRARVITLSRAYISPMPPPANTQAVITTAAGQLSNVA